MARTDALNIFESAETKAKLKEEYGVVFENLAKDTLSGVLKNKDLSGDPTAGSVEAKRMVNTDVADYGDAREGGKGTALVVKPVVVNIDTDKEIINEVEEKDASLFGVDNLISRKAVQNQGAMTRFLERAFFTEAVAKGSAFELPEDIKTAGEIAEALIQDIETTSNEFVDGVDRSLIHIICSTGFYGDLRDYMDTGVRDSHITTETGEFGIYHGVVFHPSTYLPKGIEAVGMVEGAVAQPVKVSIVEPEKIPLSDAYAFGVFFYSGTKAVMPDLIKYIGELETSDDETGRA